MANNGKVQLNYVFSAPPESVAEGERIFASHAQWLERTHPRDGEKALISYEVSQAPELSNPFDPSSEPTGNTCFILNEVYESEAGVANHFALAQEGWDDFAALGEWMQQCKVTGTPSAGIFNSLW